MRSTVPGGPCLSSELVASQGCGHSPFKRRDTQLKLVLSPKQVEAQDFFEDVTVSQL